VKNTGFRPNQTENHRKRDSELESLLLSEHVVTIDKIVVGGDGLARIQHKEKSLVVFIPMAAPGDRVKIRITKAEKNHLAGEITEILEPSAHRRAAPCEYFESCGGCSIQHIEEAEQIRQKEQILKDLLKKFVPEMDYSLLNTVPSDNNFQYRNRIQLKWDGQKFGYFKKASHQIVDITHCPISERRISDAIPEVKKKLKPTSEIIRYELRINHQNEFEFYKIGDDGEGLSFSQVNNSVNAKLVEAVCKIVSDCKPPFATELYAGAGNFSFQLLRSVPELRLESVELNSKLTEFAVKSLVKENLQKRLTFFTTDCESFVRRRPLSETLVVLDPPRAGCSPEVMKALCDRAPKDIVYISCHPVNLARDLSLLAKTGRHYKIKYLQIFDMFPQTDHFETLVHLSRE
jgi:23S rRNA (uracil1939-C5)-methyltransferase